MSMRNISRITEKTRGYYRHFGLIESITAVDTVSILEVLTRGTCTRVEFSKVGS